MRRYAWVLFIGVMLGFALGLSVYPRLFVTDMAAEDPAPDEPDRAPVATGRFIHADPTDPLHYGSGGVKVFQDLLHLEADFEVGPGPKYHVYLAPAEEVTPSTAVEETMFVDLGRLKAFRGSQSYPIPPGVELENYPYAVIWSEHLNVLISPARLELAK